MSTLNAEQVGTITEKLEAAKRHLEGFVDRYLDQVGGRLETKVDDEIERLKNGWQAAGSLHPRAIDDERIDPRDRRIYVTRGPNAGWLIPMPHEGTSEEDLLLFARIISGQEADSGPVTEYCNRSRDYADRDDRAYMQVMYLPFLDNGDTLLYNCLGLMEGWVDKSPRKWDPAGRPGLETPTPNKEPEHE